MLHHVSFAVSSIERSARFYDAALSALGYRRVFSSDKFVGYGVEENKDRFAITQNDEKVMVPVRGFHLAFHASSQSAVDAFFNKAVLTGGQDNGIPGYRPQYGENYYVAFVVDPDGYHLEAVFNK